MKTKNYNWNTGRYLLPKVSKVELSDFTVIIDESSMLTTEMFAAVLKASSNAKRIIFVGDPNQLPPIGCGKPFSDLVDYFIEKYPSNIAKLTQTMRSNISETNDFACWFKGVHKSSCPQARGAKKKASRKRTCLLFIVTM